VAGKRALITGGSRGIGAAIARRLASQGAAVAVNYRSDQDDG
jgi:Dehydrogenases with different specificities (related to short-chain alcohol dehydrogenases)